MAGKRDENRLLARGLEAGRRRDYAEAVKIFSQLSSTADERKPLLLLGRSWHGLGDFSQAVQVFQSCLRQFGPDAETSFFLARSLLALGLPQKAQHFFEKSQREGFETPQLWGLWGTAALKAKNLGKAVELLEVAVNKAPGSRGIFIAYLNAIFVRAIQLFHLGDWDLSRQMLQFLLSNGADSALLRRYLASAWRELRRPEEALPHLLKAREENPEDPVLIFQSVEAYFLTNQGDKARKELQRVQNLLPSGVQNVSAETLEAILPFQFLQQRKYRKAIFFALKNLKRNPGNGVMSLVLGEAYRELGQWEKAESHFERSRQLLKGQNEPNYGLMLVHWQRGQFEKAFVEAQRLAKAAPQDKLIAYYNVLLRCRLNQPPEENLDLVRDLIRTNEPDPFLFSALAGEYQKLGLEDLSLGWIEKALALDHGHKSAMDLLITIEDTEMKRWKEIFLRYLEMRPDDHETHRVFIHRLLAAKEYHEAHQQLLNWMARGHRNQQALRTLGFTLRMLAKFQDAFLVYRELLHLDPKNLEYLSAVVLCLFKTGRKDAALQVAKRASSQEVHNAKLQHQFGLIAFAAQEWDLASAYFKKALEIETTHWPSLQKIAEIYEKTGFEDMAKRYRTHAQNLKERVAGKK